MLLLPHLAIPWEWESVTINLKSVLVSRYGLSTDCYGNTGWLGVLMPSLPSWSNIRSAAEFHSSGGHNKASFDRLAIALLWQCKSFDSPSSTFCCLNFMFSITCFLILFVLFFPSFVSVHTKYFMCLIVSSCCVCVYSFTFILFFEFASLAMFTQSTNPHRTVQEDILVASLLYVPLLVILLTSANGYSHHIQFYPLSRKANSS